MSLLLFSNWAGKPSVKLARTERFHELVGPTLYSPSMTERKSARTCWRGLPSTQASRRKTYRAIQAVASNRPLHPTAIGVGQAPAFDRPNPALVAAFRLGAPTNLAAVDAGVGGGAK